MRQRFPVLRAKDSGRIAFVFLTPTQTNDPVVLDQVVKLVQQEDKPNNEE